MNIQIVNNHHEVIPYWINSGISNAWLLHVDAHPDIICYNDKQANLCILSFNPSWASGLTFENFISFAVQCGVVERVYWLNPHCQPKKRFWQFYTIGDKLETKKSLIFPYKFWKKTDSLDRKFPKSREVPNLDEIINQSGAPIILDIDLDAFYCNENGIEEGYDESILEDYDGRVGWERRIEETIDFLSLIRKPELITIAQSLGDNDFFLDYVDAEVCPEVQNKLSSLLEELYQQP